MPTRPMRERPTPPPVDLAGLEAFAVDLGLTVEEIIGFAQARYLDGPTKDPVTELDFDTVIAIREDLDQFCVRTVPAFWWPGSDPEAGKGATKMR